MMRQSSSRNQRARTQRLKNVLQMCILTAVFLWLLYQLKHSYDKRQALVEKNSDIPSNIDGIPEDLVKLGRKDLLRREETGFVSKVEENDEVEEGGQEEKELDVREVLEDEESAAGKDDEFGEQDQERGDEEDEHQRADEEAEEDDDKETEAEEAGLDGLNHEEDSHREHEISDGLREKLDMESDDGSNGADEELKSTEEGDEKDDTDDSEGNAADAELEGLKNTTASDKRELAAGLDKKEGSIKENKVMQINSTTATVSENFIVTNNSETESYSGHQETANIMLLQNKNISIDSTQEQNTNIRMVRNEEDESNSEDRSTVNLAEEDSAESSHKMVAGALVDLSTLPDSQSEITRNVDDEVAEQR